MNKFIIKKNKSIKEALKKLKETGHKCLIVSNKKNQLIGTLSDGDIREALIKNKSIYDKIDNYFEKKPTFLIKNNFSKSLVKNLFSKNNFGLVPIVDSNKKIVDIFYRKEILEKKIKKINIPLIIMAGGKGNRLKPFTNILPKPLIPINGKPVIDHIIDNFKKYGINNISLTLNYKSKILEAYFNESRTKVKYIKENLPLGTAGILNKFKNSNKDFFVTNCDTIIDIDYNDFFQFHKKNNNDITIAVASHEITIPYGVCKTDLNGKLIKIDEKPVNDYLISVGLYIINSKVFKLIPLNKHMDMNELISKSFKNSKVAIYPINSSSWKDVGKWDDFLKNSKY